MLFMLKSQRWKITRFKERNEGSLRGAVATLLYFYETLDG